MVFPQHLFFCPNNGCQQSWVGDKKSIGMSGSTNSRAFCVAFLLLESFWKTNLYQLWVPKLCQSRTSMDSSSYFWEENGLSNLQSFLFWSYVEHICLFDKLPSFKLKKTIFVNLVLFPSISASISSKIHKWNCLQKFRGKGICYTKNLLILCLLNSCLVDKIGICYHMLLILDVTRIERDLPQMICFWISSKGFGMVPAR